MPDPTAIRSLAALARSLVSKGVASPTACAHVGCVNGLGSDGLSFRNLIDSPKFRLHHSQEVLAQERIGGRQTKVENFTQSQGWVPSQQGVPPPGSSEADSYLGKRECVVAPEQGGREGLVCAD